MSQVKLDAISMQGLIKLSRQQGTQLNALDSCEQWIEYSSSMPRHERLEWAKGIRARYDSEKREDEDKRFQRERDWEDKEFQKERDKKSRRFQVLLFILGWISGIITILITQWILSLFNLK